MAEYFTVALLSIMIFYSFGIAFNVHKTLDKENWREKCEWALKKLQKNESCALIIRREFLD